MNAATVYVAPNPTGGMRCNVYLIDGGDDPVTVTDQRKMVNVGLLEATKLRHGPHFRIVYLKHELHPLRNELEWSMAGVKMDVEMKEGAFHAD